LLRTKPIMSCPDCNLSDTDPPEKAKPARYISFIGLDCDVKAAQLMAFIHHHVGDPAHSNAFWEYFKKKASGGSGPKPDDLFLIHSNLNQIRELFEQREDNEALMLLDRIETECC
jgi:hypothetical protein